MKKFTITAKVTLWYTLFMFIAMLSLFAFIKYFSNNSLKVQAQNDLKELVFEIGEEIHYENGTLNYGNDMRKIEGDVYLSVYDAYGNLLTGAVPRTFPMETPFSNYEIMEKELVNGERYFYYDELLNIEGYGNLWVRGVTSYSNTEKTLSNITMIALVFLPVLFIFIVTGGYIFTKTALKPVESIRKTAEQISAGEDLSIRLGMGEGKDEIQRLSATFDLMFERLQKAFEREKQFTSDISHELRTPISVVLLNAEKLLDDGKLSKENMDQVEKIQEQAKKMSDLIAQMLMLTRTETGQILLEKEEINLSDLSEILIEECQTFAKEKQVTIKNEIPKESILFADQGTLIRVFSNLLNNAIAYNVEGGSVTIRWEVEENTGTLSIEDTGIGIPEEDLPKIWNRFYRVDPSRKERSGTSSGLGLSMVQWLCKFSGWEIQVESHLHKGSVFKIEIPLETL